MNNQKKYLLQVTKPLYYTEENWNWVYNEIISLFNKGISSAVYSVTMWRKRPMEHFVLFREHDEVKEKWLNLDDMYDETIIKRRELIFEQRKEDEKVEYAVFMELYNKVIRDRGYEKMSYHQKLEVGFNMVNDTKEEEGDK